MSEEDGYHRGSGVAVAGDLAVVYRPIDQLKPDPANPRRHSKKQIRQIANSIQAFGFNVPILIHVDPFNIHCRQGRDWIEASSSRDVEVRVRPDPAIDSHFEYGSRAGWWRIMEVLGQFGAPATVSSSGRAVERLPLLAQDAVRRGHKVSAHGWRWEGHADLDEAEERDRIARTVAAITAVTGIRPIGWHTRSPGSVNTRRLLVEEGGFLYDSDAYNDDLPYFVAVGDKRHLVLLYAFDTNDMQFFHTNRFSGAADFAAYVIDAFDWLHREGAHAPKMMSIGLHLRMIGRPGRISALHRILRHLADRGDAWIARRVDIANHLLARFP